MPYLSKIGLGLSVGVGATFAALAAVQEAATARSNIENQVSTLSSLTTTLNGLLTSQQSQITAITSTLTPLAADATQLCAAVTAAAAVTPTDAMLPNQITAIDALVAALSSNNCP